MIQLMHHQNPFCVSFLLSTAFLVTQATSIYLCDSPTTEKVQSCLDEVENAESKLPAGPCKSSDWECICIKQQGMITCTTPCPNMLDGNADAFSQANCHGQHNITIQAYGGPISYSWSPLESISGLQGDEQTSLNLPASASTTEPKASANNSSFSSVAHSENIGHADMPKASINTALAAAKWATIGAVMGIAMDLL